MWYVLIFFSIVGIDRATKWLALYYFSLPIHINKFLSFTLAVNRGITWGFFHSTNDYLFWMVTGVIVGLTFGLAIYTYNRWKHSHVIVGELLVLTGSVSNIIDRFWYQGVIDFILLHYGKWSWPIFNIADMSIVFGVAVMMVQRWHSD